MTHHVYCNVMEVVEAHLDSPERDWDYEVVDDPADRTREAVRVFWEDEVYYVVLCDRVDDRGERSCEVREYAELDESLVAVSSCSLSDGYLGIGHMLAI